MKLTSNSKFQIYKTGRAYQYILKARNGKIILSGEEYTTKQNCLKGVQSVQKNAVEDDYYEERAYNNKYYFFLKAANGEVIGFSQPYTNTSGRRNGMEFVKTNAPKATIEDLT